MKNNKHKLTFIVAGILALASWVIALTYWSKLPSVIPTHFGLSGQPDAWSDKSIFYVFLVPFLQTLMFGLYLFLYAKPQYSDMPTTLLLMAMEEKKREHAFSLIRTMLVVVAVWTGILFTYITYMMNFSALKKNIGLSPYIMFGLIAGLLLWLIWYTIKVYKVTRDLLKTK